jgi:hypothetical protein
MGRSNRIALISDLVAAATATPEETRSPAESAGLNIVRVNAEMVALDPAYPDMDTPDVMTILQAFGVNASAVVEMNRHEKIARVRALRARAVDLVESSRADTQKAGLEALRRVVDADIVAPRPWITPALGQLRLVDAPEALRVLTDYISDTAIRTDTELNAMSNVQALKVLDCFGVPKVLVTTLGRMQRVGLIRELQSVEMPKDMTYVTPVLLHEFGVPLDVASSLHRAKRIGLLAQMTIASLSNNESEESEESEEPDTSAHANKSRRVI